MELLISINFFNNLSLFNIISDLKGILILASQLHFDFFIVELYPSYSQFDSHNDILL